MLYVVVGTLFCLFEPDFKLKGASKTFSGVIQIRIIYTSSVFTKIKGRPQQEQHANCCVAD